MKDDAALLRSYVDEGSQDAFAELVRRHLDLVYGAAMRRTRGDPHQSADIAQQVFTTLARQAPKLLGHPVLSAWLHTATRNAALNLMISEQRRKIREATAAEFAAVNPASLEWERVRPVLDEAVDDLGENDRAAIVLRFLERRSFAQIGTILRTTEDAARMRTERALERLRAALGRRGITSTATALSAMVAGHPAIAAPAGLAASISSHAVVAGSAVAAGSALSFVVMNTKTIAAAALVAGLFFGVGSYVGKNYAEATAMPPAPVTPTIDPSVVTSLRDENTKLVGEITRLNSANTALTGEKSALQAAVMAAKKGLPGPALSPTEQKQRAMLNNLRQIAAARDQFIAENGRPPMSVLEITGADRYIRQVNAINGEDYSNLQMSGDKFTLTDADGLSVTYEQKPYEPSPQGVERQQQMRSAMERARELGRKVNPSVRPAIEAYQAANNGNLPPSNEALIPFFPTPQQGADFVEYLEAEKAARGGLEPAKRMILAAPH